MFYFLETRPRPPLQAVAGVLPDFFSLRIFSPLFGELEGTSAFGPTAPLEGSVAGAPLDPAFGSLNGCCSPVVAHTVDLKTCSSCWCVLG